MHPNLVPSHGLFEFRAPYHTFDPITLDWTPQTPVPGTSAAWFLRPYSEIYPELDWVRDRPIWMPLFIVLPEPQDILPLAPVLRRLNQLTPRAVIPSAGAKVGGALRTLLAAPPLSVADAVTDHLANRHLIPDMETRQFIKHIFRAAPQVTSIQRLADKMCQSRRSLGRFLREKQLPVPSHWLQFARILHVAIQIQNTDTSINRVAARFGYPDGFTMSNAMKRLIGYRPSFVRRHLGWEWILEMWVRRETDEST